MSLDLLLVAVYVWVDDALRTLDLARVRQRGPEPTLTDSEVITMGIVGSFLGLASDVAIFTHFRRYHAAAFPRLLTIHLTSFTRQAANLWDVQRRLHLYLAERVVPADDRWIVDSLPIPVCRFGRAPFCRRFRGQAAYGHDHGSRHKFYGFRLHVRISRSGVIRAAELAPGNISDIAMLGELRLPANSMGLGDRNYHAPDVLRFLQQHSIRLYVPFRTRKGDPHRKLSSVISQLRWLVETVLGQLSERYHLKRLRCRDLWHLQGRIHRAVLSHTLAVWLCRQSGIHGLQFAKLVAA